MATDTKDLYALRHSMAHIMATAIQHLWPEVKLGVGPVVDDGFYYDVEIENYKISEEDLDAIEKEMKKIVSENQPFVKSRKSIEEALQWAKSDNQPFKEELLNDLNRQGTTQAKDIDPAQLGVEGDSSEIDSVSFYTNGDFTDLCRGPHVAGTGQASDFKLIRVAGAYWRGDETKPQMQRIYGVGFASKEGLQAHLKMLEEAKQRDHRKIGKEMDLFTFSELVGSGLPMFTPKGTWLRELLGSYSQQIRAKRGFQRVWTPHMTKPDLYEKSGHWSKFGDELFKVESQESSDVFALKPMNCPHHTRIYDSQPRSYKDLPIRYMENTTDYRDEKTGELHGLSRVRSLTQDDSHVFCREEQIENEVTQLVQSAQEMYGVLDMNLKFRLSFRDEGDGYLGDKQLWENAQEKLEKLAKKNNLDYFLVEGEAAFYGPKIDFIATDAIGRDWQVATVQLDFVQPARFELEYVDADGSKKTPVMIHCALLGTIERFLSVYIEHTNGRFPLWLAPEQVRILQINDSVADYARKVKEQLSTLILNEPLEFNKLRFTIDDSNNSLGKKIKDAEKAKVPLMLIIGPRDKEGQTVSVRWLEDESSVELASLTKWINEQNEKALQR